MTALGANLFTTDEPDLLAGSLLRNLGEQFRTRTSWSFIKTLLFSTISFGIYPLIVWPMGLRRLIMHERVQMVNLAEWMRLRSGNPNAARLTMAADRIKPIGLLSYMPIFLATLVAVVVVTVSGPANLPFRQALDSTFHYGRTSTQLPQSTTSNVFLVWTAGLTVGYVMHWLQLLLHAANMRNAVRAFNNLATVEGLPPVREPRGIGLRPIWLAAALIMMTANAIWAIPMMLAGGMQRRYVEVTGPTIRSALAGHLRSLLLVRRPAMRVPMAVSLPRHCPNPACRSNMSRIANFCPRCGRHVGPEIDQLA